LGRGGCGEGGDACREAREKEGAKRGGHGGKAVSVRCCWTCGGGKGCMEGILRGNLFPKTLFVPVRPKHLFRIIP
jgi:hypothetical protein